MSFIIYSAKVKAVDVGDVQVTIPFDDIIISAITEFSNITDMRLSVISDLDPLKLKHRPMWLLSGYDAHDGHHAGNSDCKFLSVGWAQYGDQAVTVKALRHTGDRWSRQSEELPLHRALHLAAFAILAMAKAEVDGADEQHGLTIPAGTLPGQVHSLDLAFMRGSSEWRQVKNALLEQDARQALGAVARALDAARAAGLLGRDE